MVASGEQGSRIPAGTRLNGIYVVERQIAVGGMGEVYAGRAAETGVPVAIKMIRPELAADPNIISLFRREALALHQLRHEAIVAYYVFSIDPDLNAAYLAMEFVPGRSLSEMAREGPLGFEFVRILQKRVAAGLHTAHTLGVIHRDVSSDNIILPDGDPARAKIIDFGIAKNTLDKSTIIGDGFAGKNSYISPEQLGMFGGKVTAKSDVYSLGLVLVEALLGRKLDMGGNLAEVVTKRETVPDLTGVDRRMQPLIRQMLDPNPDNRPTMDDVATREVTGMGLTSPPVRDATVLAQRQANAPAFAPLPEVASRPNRMPIIAGGAAALAAVVAVAAFLLWPADPTTTRPVNQQTPSLNNDQARLEEERRRREQAEAAERQRQAQLEQQRQDQLRQEQARRDQEATERERQRQAQLEQQRQEQLRQEQARKDQEAAERERQRQAQLEQQRQDQLRQEQARRDQEAAERERQRQAQLEQQRQDQLRQDQARRDQEAAERERQRQAQLDQQRQDQLRQDQARREQEEAERRRQAASVAIAEQQRQARERAEQAQRDEETRLAQQRENERKLQSEADAARKPPQIASRTDAGGSPPIPGLRDCSQCPDLVAIPEGSMQMGSNRDPAERPARQVSVKAFAMSRYPVTVGQWRECVLAGVCPKVDAADGVNADRQPVNNVNFDDAQKYVAWLTQVTGRGYRLPSEAEWEYAAKAGAKTRYWWGEEFSAEFASCRRCGPSRSEPLSVGGFKPNAFGLYDMTGNVAQWTLDCWHRDYRGAPKDASPWTAGGRCREQVVRGGSWSSEPADQTVTSRSFYDPGVRHPSFGLRVVRSP